MAHGIHQTILEVDLTAGTHERRPLDGLVLRRFLGGGALSAYLLLRRGAAQADPLGPDNPLVIAPGVTTGAAVSGVSRCSVMALSPLTGAIGDGQAGGALGPALKRCGVDALVIVGQASRPTYLVIGAQGVRFEDASALTGQDTIAVREQLRARHPGRGVSILQCGPAGERLVRHAALLVDGHDWIGRTGLGAVLGSKRLRAIVLLGDGELSFADPERLKALAKLGNERLASAGFPTTLRKHGTPGVVNFQAKGGNLPVHNFSSSWQPEHERLDGSSYQATLGAGEHTCFGCVVRCRKTVRAEQPWPLSDQLGGPEFETLGVLGSNLELTDPAAVARANELCGRHGLDTIGTGCLAAFTFECLERGLVPAALVPGELPLGFGRPEALFWLIEAIATRRPGLGALLADGFGAAIAAFGPASAAYAMQVKGQGLPAHVPQVKPSQALMYAVAPQGADHQSCEHDWLIDGCGEEAWGLGLYGRSARPALDDEKLRLVASSQAYYSLLDSLCLCMFCWGPGNLYTYRELEELVSAVTGWQVTFWELMKAGERRVIMMRWINQRRGLGRDQDRLPDRIFEPLPSGPAQGRCADRASFGAQVERYYGMIGCDEQGRPTAGRLAELGLEEVCAPSVVSEQRLYNG